MIELIRVAKGITGEDTWGMDFMEATPLTLLDADLVVGAVSRSGQLSRTIREAAATDEMEHTLSCIHTKIMREEYECPAHITVPLISRSMPGIGLHSTPAIIFIVDDVNRDIVLDARAAIAIRRSFLLSLLKYDRPVCGTIYVDEYIKMPALYTVFDDDCLEGTVPPEFLFRADVSKLLAMNLSLHS